MPKMTKNGKVKKSELPDTLRKSPKKAQKTFAKAHDAALKSYGEGERAHRTAFSALKHSFEKVGDHWEKKSKKGPSDAKASRRASTRKAKTAEGVDANASKEHLMDVAKRLDVKGRSRMTKARPGRGGQEGEPARELARTRQLTATGGQPAMRALLIDSTRGPSGTAGWPSRSRSGRSSATTTPANWPRSSPTTPSSGSSRCCW